MKWVSETMPLEPFVWARLRSAIEKLEELAIEASLAGPVSVAEAMAAQFEALAALLFDVPEGKLAATVCTGTAALLHRIGAAEVPAPRRLMEQLLETLSTLGSFTAGEDVAARLAADLEQLAPRAPRPAPLPPPAGEVDRLFVGEATACLDKVESSLLAIERATASPELLRDVARELHNLKGGAGMSGHESIVTVAHEMETRVLGLLGDHAADRPAVVDSLLHGLDAVRTEIESIRQRERERAVALDGSRSAALNHLLFEAGGCRMAIRVLDIGRVARVPASTPVPFTPHFVIGLVNLAGELMPLVDLAERLGLEPAGGTEPWALVVAGKEGERIALLVDRVAEIRPISPEELSPPPADRPEFSAIATLAGEGRVPVLDTQRVRARGAVA